MYTECNSCMGNINAPGCNVRFGLSSRLHLISLAHSRHLPLPRVLPPLPLHGEDVSRLTLHFRDKARGYQKTPIIEKKAKGLRIILVKKNCFKMMIASKVMLL